MTHKRKLEDMDQEVPDDDWLQPRKIPVQNIVCRLFNRQTYPGKQNVHSSLLSRQLHQNACPQFTLMGVEKPAVFLKKFSPNGKFLFAFSMDQTCIEIFKYLGPAGGASLIHNLEGDFTTDSNVGFQAFKKYFKHLHTVAAVTEPNEQLNRECSLFTEDGRYLIVASSAYHSGDPSLSQILTSNESLTNYMSTPFENYTLHLIDLHTGKLQDRIYFNVDRIFLTHNHGIYLYNNTLAVLSLQHQTIHIYELSGGKFKKKLEIGRFCYPDDEAEVDAYGEVIDPDGVAYPAYGEACINALKHRLLVLLYKNCGNDTRRIREFCQLFGAIKDLKMMKMQLLDEDHLFIKFTKEKILANRSQSDVGGPSLFAVYRISTATMLNVYRNTSEELLALMDNFSEFFRNLPSLCSPSNNVHAKLLQQRFKQTILHARFGGQQEMVKRLLSQLPVSCQSYSNSPYLDLALFSYDDKWVSMFERPKTSGEYPIKFYNRDSGLLRYKMYTGVQQVSGAARASGKRLAAFTFHPTDPFVISVQRANGDYVVNFHVYNDNKKVPPTNNLLTSTFSAR